jgi:hypothetical protein
VTATDLGVTSVIETAREALYIGLMLFSDQATDTGLPLRRVPWEPE